MKTGKVYLVGAGPGDPGLITVKGLELLQQAAVIVYDRLLDDRLLALATPAAERIYVGKAAGSHTKSQDEINQLLVAKAKEGKTVVRLKGGDPFVLGRGGEEAEVLAASGILFEIVPGVTSAVAVPAYAGIPVTHRGLASSFAVITGHEDPGKEATSLNWEKLATGVGTLVFLMGMKNLPEIVARLVEFGRPADTPVAVIGEGTRPGQKTVVGSLSDIVAKVKDSHLSPPAITVVGQVVDLRDKLRWFDNRPLSGKRILVTRARHQASVLSQQLTECGAEPVELAAIDIKPITDSKELDEAISNIKRYHWIMFTSVNGVAAFWKRLNDLKLDSRALCGLQIGAIGPATAEALVAGGITPDYVPQTYTTAGILDGLKHRDIAGQRFLLPRADKADKELVEGIRKLGAEVRDVTAYHTVPADDSIAKAKQMLASGVLDIITFTSSSTVANLVNAFHGEPWPGNRAKIACIGPKTAEAAVKAGLKVDILASKQTIAGLVGAIEQYFREEM
ncbi:uroporphyrinogen-III C-methyltransferase [Chloroflexota bacterium]